MLFLKIVFARFFHCKLYYFYNFYSWYRRDTLRLSKFPFPHWTHPWVLVFIDYFCLNQLSLWRWTTGDFLTPLFLLYLSVSWHLTVRIRFVLFSIYLYQYILVDCYFIQWVIIYYHYLFWCQIAHFHQWELFSSCLLCLTLTSLHHMSISYFLVQKYYAK